jgi:ketosteroid isomerase-like protein
MTAPEDAVRARRRLTNKLIAAHEAPRLRPFFAKDARLIAGDGSLILGADAIVEAFAAQFADRTFTAYARTPDHVEIDDPGDRAAETGRWVGAWKTGAEMSGTYLAAWRKVTGQWVIESELYVTLATTPAPPTPSS